MRNLFVLGLDEANRKLLEPMAQELDVKLHSLLYDRRAGIDELPDVDEAIKQAQAELDAFEGSVDGIISFWDFPGRPIASYLCHQRGLRETSLTAVLACTHKYWARVQQAGVLNASEIPAFAPVDPLAYTDTVPGTLDLGLDYPFWIKPVGAYCSMYAYRIADEAHFAAALEQIREGIEPIGKPLDQLIAKVPQEELPPEVRDVRGHFCIAEQELSGQLCTLEGYVWRGKFHSLGVFDSFKYLEFPSFERYQYPSTLPPAMIERMEYTARLVMRHMGYDHGTFNIEFFCNVEKNTAHVLEVNSRLSQSHGPLFEIVEGFANLKIMMEIALDEAPSLPKHKGSAPMAAVWFYRRQGDAVVTRVPTPEELREVEAKHPGVKLLPAPLTEGMRLSDLPNQDAYSFELSRVIVAGEDEAQIKERYEACIQDLPFEFAEE